MNFGSALWIVVVCGFRLTRQEHSNDVLALNCEALKKVKQQNDMESLEWRVEGSGNPIAECEYKNTPTPKCEVKHSLESKRIKVLNISRTNGALFITRLSPTQSSPTSTSVVFLCTVRTLLNVDNGNVTVDFSVEYIGPRTTPSTPSRPTITLPALQGNDSFPKVQTESGEIVGRLQTLPLGKSVHEYLGIPYAEPPVGKMRFAVPKPAKPWSGIKEAKEFGAACPQPQLPFPPSKIGEENEDCLFLNVFVPSTIKPDDKMAVMVWIHGGGFVTGSSTEYPGHVLAAFNDVIVVTFNYRLGILGFLSIPETDFKGNYGMFDQILALKWVQTNIARFGGDPNNVTVFGESAGGISVALHLISTKSRDLFQKAIVQSGAASSPYLTGKAASVESVKKFATAANCPSNIIDCLRNKSAKEIISFQANLSTSLPRDMKELTTPIVDGDFMSGSPQKLYKRGKFIPNVSVITGFASHEASLATLSENARKHGVSKEEFEASVTSTLKDGGIKYKIAEVAELVQYQYTNHSHPHNKTTARERLIELQNDFMVVAPMIFEAKALAKAGKQTYLYLFEHRPDFPPFPEWASAVPGVDIGFVFGAPFTRVSSVIKFVTPKYSAIEKGFSWYIMKLWTDFAKFGSPTSDSSSPITWPPFTVKDQFYLALDVKPKLKQKYRAREVAFWNSIIIPKIIRQAKRRKATRKQ